MSCGSRETKRGRLSEAFAASRWLSIFPSPHYERFDRYALHRRNSRLGLGMNFRFATPACCEAREKLRRYAANWCWGDREQELLKQHPNYVPPATMEACVELRMNR